MFCRAKVSGPNTYIQIVENHRDGKKVRQRVIATLGRLDHLQKTGALERLLHSACRFSEQLMVLAAQPGSGDGEDGAEVRHIGPALVFERLWRDSGCQRIVNALLAERRFQFDVERAVFASVLHRIMISGSDRAACTWMHDQVIDGAAGLELQHLYRAMAWLGEPRPGEDGEEPKERRRYVVCRNPAEARRDAASRAAMVADLEGKLKAGAKALIGNRGYRRYLETEGEGFRIDADKVREEEKYDGIWVLRTNTALPMREVALRYKELWLVEQAFRTAKSLLDTRPIFHKCDETIRGHVFCSFLALLMQKELFLRMANAGIEAEWAAILRDLDALTEAEIENGGRRFLVRSQAKGATVAVLRCVGARLPVTIRRIDGEPADEKENPAVA